MHLFSVVVPHKHILLQTMTMNASTSMHLSRLKTLQSLTILNNNAKQQPQASALQPQKYMYSSNPSHGQVCWRAEHDGEMTT